MLVSTHMPLARHDAVVLPVIFPCAVSTHMPLARHDGHVRPKHTLSWFLLTCLLRGMTLNRDVKRNIGKVSTHMPLARHDDCKTVWTLKNVVSTHMPLARHDVT